MYVPWWMGSWRWNLVFFSCMVWCEWFPGGRNVLGQSHDLKEVEALIEYDKQLDVLHEQSTGSLRDSVGFTLLYHMREDRWKQGGDWESLHYTNISIAALDPHNRYHAANFSSLMSEEAYDEIFFGQLNISRVLQRLPTIRDMELFDALHVHQIRLLTILGRYSNAHIFSSDAIRRHTINFGHDHQLLGLHQQVHQHLSNQTLRAVRLAKSQLVYLQELQDLNRRLRYLTEQRGLLHFVGGQSWLSAGDAVAAVSWFDAAIAAHPCLHQAYYRLAQAVAASPLNNPQNRSLPSSASATSASDATLRERIEMMENVLRRIYVNADSNLVQLLSSAEDAWSMAVQRARANSDQGGFFGWWFARKSSVSELLSLDPLQQHRALRCTFGDELQYFHVLLRYSQVSDSWDGDEDDSHDGDTSGDGHRDLDEDDNEDDDDGITVSGNLFAASTRPPSASASSTSASAIKTRAKVSLSASHPAAFAQQSPSQSPSQPQSQQHKQKQPSKANEPDAQPAVVRDYVKVVQAAMYWSLFTLADAIPGEEPLAFFYLQQARALERFRVDDPRYSQYSATDSHRQVTHIQRTFTAEYYPQPSYPAEVPLPRAAYARVRHQHPPPDVAPRSAASSPLLFAHDLFTPDELTNQSIPMDSLRAQWTPPMDEVLYGDSSARPVFIVGFFRSGSTLLETQLSRQHSSLVWGLGEHSAFATQMHHLQQDMLQLAAAWEAQTQQTQAATTAAAAGATATSHRREAVEAIQRETEAVREERYRRVLRRHTARIDAAMQHRCAQYLTAGTGGGDRGGDGDRDGDGDRGSGRGTVRHRYDDRITKLHPRCTRVIDKMLLNYRNVGLIHLLYPQAVVLHTVRDPMDTMWSGMTHRFGDSAAYTLNIRLLVEEFTWYLQTMRHFRRTLPPRPPIWALSSAATGSMNEKKNEKKASRAAKPTWQNVALCPPVSLRDSVRSGSTDTGGRKNETQLPSSAFPLFCSQRRQLKSPASPAVRRRRQQTASEAKEEAEAVSLLPMVDVRYDAMITRPQHVLREVYGLLQLPLPPSLASISDGASGGDGDATSQSPSNRTAATSETTDSETTGPVRTASYLQVRRPINDAAQGKWRRYATQLRHTLWPLWQDAWKRLQRAARDGHSDGGDEDAAPFNTDDDEDDVAGVAMNWSGALTDDGYDYRAALRLLAAHLDATHHE